MKKVLFLFLVFYSTIAVSQEYDFISKDAVVVNKWKYIDLLNKIPKPVIDYRLESGKPFTQTYFDSIVKTKDSHKLKTIYLSDSIANKVTLILKPEATQKSKKTTKHSLIYRIKKKVTEKKSWEVRSPTWY